mmetsp:Transcript_28190/g.74396  ORF Transcript_28190/g.74396 Transcript_28190/m.74396 type:complete len:251 (+) Transcript_28190:422-1174(+)
MRQMWKDRHDAEHQNHSEPAAESFTRRLLKVGGFLEMFDRVFRGLYGRPRLLLNGVHACALLADNRRKVTVHLIHLRDLRGDSDDASLAVLRNGVLYDLVLSGRLLRRELVLVIQQTAFLVDHRAHYFWHRGSRQFTLLELLHLLDLLIKSLLKLLHREFFSVPLGGLACKMDCPISKSLFHMLRQLSGPRQALTSTVFCALGPIALVVVGRCPDAFAHFLDTRLDIPLERRVLVTSQLRLLLREITAFP